MEATLEKSFERGLKQMEKMASPLEQGVQKIPSALYLGFGFDCCIVATALALAGKTKYAVMVGTWAPFALMLGLYAKLDQKGCNQ